MKNSILYKIAKIVADRFEVDPEFIFQDTRRHAVTDVRAIYHFMCNKYTKERLRVIGQFSKKMGRSEPHHHASIVYAIKKVKSLYEVDKKFREDVDSISEVIEKQLTYDKFVSRKNATTISNIIERIFYEDDYEFLTYLDLLVDMLYEHKNKEIIENLIKTLKKNNEGLHKATQDDSAVGMV